MDPYSDSWCTNDISKVEKSISDIIYRKELNENTISKYLDFGTESDYGDSGWSIKGELNFPGPFYTGESDTCGTGIIEAPMNVIFDDDYCEHVMIQPRNKKELLQLWNAGAVEVFGSYYCDGNKYWTIQSVKDWWRNKDELINFLKNKDLIKNNCNQEKRYKYYLLNEAEEDLKKYCFFLDNGFHPTNEKLPELK